MSAIVLPGWTCEAEGCGVFNGEAREPRDECRACGAPCPDRWYIASVPGVDVRPFLAIDLEEEELS